MIVKFSFFSTKEIYRNKEYRDKFEMVKTKRINFTAQFFDLYIRLTKIAKLL